MTGVGMEILMDWAGSVAVEMEEINRLKGYLGGKIYVSID